MTHKNVLCIKQQAVINSLTTYGLQMKRLECFQYIVMEYLTPSNSTPSVLLNKFYKGSTNRGHRGKRYVVRVGKNP